MTLPQPQAGTSGSHRVLVAYATTMGSTKSIARVIAGSLHGHGVAADLRSAGTVDDLSPYGAVVLASAVYLGRWHRDARRFVHAHADALRRRPLWLVSSGPLDRSADLGTRPPVGDAAHALKVLGARGHVTFGGYLAPDARGLSGLARWRVRHGRAGDFRDPTRIREWADGVVEELAREWGVVR